MEEEPALWGFALSATEDELRRLLYVVDRAQDGWALEWLLAWATGRRATIVASPRGSDPQEATPERVVGYFEEYVNTW